MASARTTREGERRLSLGTLAIASLASATAAVVVSTFWRSGTPIAAAVTPVVVALVSEMLHRPTAVIAEKLTSEADALPLSARISRLAGREPEPTRVRTVERPPGREGELPPRVPRDDDGPAGAGPASRPGGDGEMRVYPGTRAGSPPPRSARSLPLKAIAITAALACAIGVTVLTVPELLAGQSLGGQKTTVFGGGEQRQPSSSEERDSTAQDQQETTTEPPQTAPEQPAPQQTTPKKQPTPPKTTQQPQQQKKSGSGQTTTPTTPTKKAP